MTVYSLTDDGEATPKNKKLRKKKKVRRERPNYPTLEEMILDAKLPYEAHGNIWRVQCPLSLHNEHNDGVDTKWSCDADLQKQVWICRSCGASGGAYDFSIAIAEGLDGLLDVQSKRQRYRPTKATDEVQHWKKPPRAEMLDAVAGALGDTPTLNFGSQPELAQELLKRFNPLVFTHGSFYWYDLTEGIWVEQARSVFSRRLQSWDGLMIKADPSAHRKGRRLYANAGVIRGTLECLEDTVIDETFFDTAQPAVVCNNCALILTPNGVEVAEPSEKHRVNFRVPVTYDAASPAIAPRFVQALGEWFDGEGEDGEAKARLLQEFVGVALFSMSIKFQKALALLGPGAAGKSTFLEIVSKLFPPKTISHVPVHEFAHQYYRATLAGKRLNVCTELPMADVEATESFKAVISGDAIQARHPGERPFTFSPKAGHIFAGNLLPRVLDTTRGFWRRFMVVEFNRSFEGHEDRNLIEHLVQNELAGIFAWAVEGAKRVFANGRYSVCAASDMATEQWQEDSDPVLQFTKECCTPLPPDCPFSECTAVEGLYFGFSPYCDAIGARLMGRRMFGKRLIAAGVVARRSGQERRYAIKLNKTKSMSPGHLKLIP